MAVSIATVARAGMAYLPLTGPPAMRLQVVKTSKLTPPASNVAKPAATSSASGILTTNSACDTNSPEFAGGNTNAAGAAKLVPISIGAANPLEIPAPGVEIYTMAAPDFLGVTPEMLTTYFQPLAGGTNAAAVTGPFRIGFIPPLAPPDKSSHAEYIVK